MQAAKTFRQQDEQRVAQALCMLDRHPDDNQFVPSPGYDIIEDVSTDSSLPHWKRDLLKIYEGADEQGRAKKRTSLARECTKTLNQATEWCGKRMDGPRDVFNMADKAATAYKQLLYFQTLIVQEKEENVRKAKDSEKEQAGKECQEAKDWFITYEAKWKEASDALAERVLEARDIIMHNHDAINQALTSTLQRVPVGEDVGTETTSTEPSLGATAFHTPSTHRPFFQGETMQQIRDRQKSIRRPSASGPGGNDEEDETGWTMVEMKAPVFTNQPTDQGFKSILEPRGSGIAFGASNKDHMMQMFSQSLAATFAIRNIVAKPFEGDPDEFEQFRVLWIRADNQMEAMNFTPAAKFWELKKVLKGDALNYVKGLPTGENASYANALNVLHTLYGESQSALRRLVKDLMNIKASGGSLEDRRRVHAQIVQHRNAVNSLGVNSAEVQLAMELAVIEGKLDPAWRKEWVKYCSKKKEKNHPLGANVTYTDLVVKLHESIKEMEKLQPAGGEKKKEEKKTAAAAVAGKPAKQKFGPQKSGQQAQKQPANKQTAAKTGAAGAKPKDYGEIQDECRLCLQDGKQKYVHSYPLTCPKIKSKRPEVVLTKEQLVALVKKDNLCRNCFSTKHQAAKCSAPEFVFCRQDGCTERHHKFLHQ